MTDDNVRSLLVHPALWPHLAEWVRSRGLDLIRCPGEFETWTISPSTAAMRAVTVAEQEQP